MAANGKSSKTVIQEKISCPTGLNFEIQDRLFMGAGSSRGWVSPEAFEKFLDQIVTPRFPRGFTVGRSAGQWRHPDGKISKEPSWLLTIVHDPSPQLDREVEQIADAYKYGFKQEAVIRVRSMTCVSFVVNKAADAAMHKADMSQAKSTMKKVNDPNVAGGTTAAKTAASKPK